LPQKNAIFQDLPVQIWSCGHPQRCCARDHCGLSWRPIRAGGSLSYGNVAPRSTHGGPLRGHDWPVALDTSAADLSRDFFYPALSRAIRYDRAVGSFSSGWLRANAKGMLEFAMNGGKGRWITSPILAEEDWEALQSGDAARRDPALRKALERNISDLAEALEKDTMSALTWMVADGVLDFKLALPRNKLERGNFHDKFGVLSDAEGDRVSFNGSYNDSVQGTRNYESIKIFCSWKPAFAPLVRDDVQRFERLWDNEDLNVRVFDMPEAAREQILRLRTQERPYKKPDWLGPDSVLGSEAFPGTVQPSIPAHVSLRRYQEQAVEAWFAPSAYRPVQSWNCPDLLSAIYLQLYLWMTESLPMRRCVNPPCGTPFPLTRKDKQVCSRSCGSNLRHYPHLQQRPRRRVD
jgi:hypothetical protein